MKSYGTLLGKVILRIDLLTYDVGVSIEGEDALAGGYGGMSVRMGAARVGAGPAGGGRLLGGAHSGRGAQSGGGTPGPRSRAPGRPRVAVPLVDRLLTTAPLHPTLSSCPPHSTPPSHSLMSVSNNSANVRTSLVNIRSCGNMTASHSHSLAPFMMTSFVAHTHLRCLWTWSHPHFSGCFSLIFCPPSLRCRER